jgi:hypothetical protein
MNLMDYRLAKQNENDHLLEAAHDRLVNEALAAASRRPSRFCFILSRLGRLLVKWGTQLQQDQPVSAQPMNLKKTA